ncbi:MAG: hypothetical protein WHU94_02275 [Thermogemmata sp.]|jgi:hypothetical protein|nr:hypothetical protein [Gemmataceae bacterium]GIW85452.1 MAG: hypothetical protein KatS3mg107_1112 [Gemmataceae bacterium]
MLWMRACSWTNARTGPDSDLGRLGRCFGNIVLFLLGLAPLAVVAQPPPPPAAKVDDQRYGIRLNLRLYPQDTPKAALQSLLTAIEKKQYAYAVAHLLDPATVDARLSDRAMLFLDRAEKELRQERLRQQKTLVPSEPRLPAEPQQWKELVLQRAREHAFRELVQQVQQRLEAEPHILRSLAKILAAGQFTDTANGVKASHPEVLDGAVYFRQIGPRWFIDNRREDSPSPPPASKEPSPKDKED